MVSYSRAILSMLSFSLNNHLQTGNLCKGEAACILDFIPIYYSMFMHKEEIMQVIMIRDVKWDRPARARPEPAEARLY